MKRPIGLILATIVLGLAAFVLVAAGLTTMFASFGVTHGFPGPAAIPPGSSAPPGFLTAVLLITGLIELLLATWAIVTIVGLIRLRSWARYSVLVIGALLALFGGASALIIMVLPSLLAKSPQSQPLPDSVMHGLLLALALFYVFLAAIGISWLVYFNLRSVKAFFLPQYSAGTIAPQPSPTAQSLATPGGLPYLPAPPPPAAVVSARPSRFSNVPTPVTVIACLLLLGAFLCGVIAFLPLPAMALGFILTGWPEHLLYVVLALVCTVLGIGLLRVDNRARMATLGLLAFAALNVLLTLTPHYRAQSALYQQMVRQSMHLPGTSTLPIVDPNSFAVLVPGLIVALLVYASAAWVLHHNRSAFHR